MEIKFYYATVINDNFSNSICYGILDTFAEIKRSDYIQIDSYDVTKIGKMWTGSEWVDNPNYVPPEKTL